MGKMKRHARDKGLQKIRRSDANNILDRVKALAEPALEAEGIELVLVEFQRESGGYVLRIFADKEGGITLGDCGIASRYIGDLLEIYEDQMPPYRLEVSSPGLNRPLTKEDHFNRFAGKAAVITMKEPIDGRRKFKGELVKASNGVAKLIVDDEPMEFEIRAMLSARLHYKHGEN